jgi:hypothetical protein
MGGLPVLFNSNKAAFGHERLAVSAVAYENAAKVSFKN